MFVYLRHAFVWVVFAALVFLPFHLEQMAERNAVQASKEQVAVTEMPVDYVEKPSPPRRDGVLEAMIHGSLIKEKNGTLSVTWKGNETISVHTRVTLKLSNLTTTTTFGILAVNPGKHMISALDDGNGLFHLTFHLAGRYTFLAHQGIKRSTFEMVTDVSEFYLNVVGNATTNEHNDNLEPCQLEKNGLLRLDGDWIGPLSEFGVDESMRTNWTFRPRHCALETFSKDEILSLRKERKTIFVTGTSIQRGVFLSLVDMVLDGDEKNNMKESRVGKCWGRAQVQKGNLKIVYQDLRTNRMRSDVAPGSVVECHNERRASDPGAMFANATRLLEHVFRDAKDWPDVWFFFSGLDPLATTFQTDLVKKMVATVPSEWNGTIYMLDKYFSGMTAFATTANYNRYFEQTARLQEQIGDGRIRLIASLNLQTDMRFYAEEIGFVGVSQHFHRWCPLGSVHDGVVCSNVTDVFAQLVLSRAIAPKGKNHWTRLGDDHEETGEATICADCPAGLLPFHVKAVPNFTCTTGPLQPVTSAGESWPQLPCPAGCFARKPDGYFNSQSGVVEVRSCKEDQG